MKGQFKKLFTQSAIYSVGNIANKVIGFILLPIYTDHLSIADYGVLGLLETIAVILVAVLSFRIPTAMIRWCSDTDDKEEQQSILFTAFAGLFILSAMMVISLYSFSDYFALTLFKNIDYSIFFELLFISVALEVLSKVPLEYLRFQEKATTFISINLTKLAIVLGLNIYLIVWLEWGIMGILVSQLIGHAAVVLFSSPYLLSNFSYRFNSKAAKEMVKYGFPLVFSTLSAVLLSLADRFILPYFHDYGDLGIYNLGYKISSVTNVFLITAFQLGFLPIAFKRYKDVGFKPFISKVLTYFAFLVVLFTLLISYFSKEVITTFARNSDFWDAYNLVPLIGFIFIFKAIQYVFTLGLHFSKKTKFNINIVLIGLILNVVLNIILIPKYDYYGAIVASILSSIVTLLYSYRLSMRYFPVRFELKKMARLIGICLIFTALLYVINPLGASIRFPLKVSLLGIFVLAMVWLNYFDKPELNFAKNTVKNLRKTLLKGKI